MKLRDKLDWNDLQLLLVLSETGNVSDAASRLDIDPTTVTRRIRRMEKNVGFTLLERVKGGADMSNKALSLVRIAQSIDRRIEDALSDAPQDEPLSGTVRITAIDIILDLIIPALARLKDQNPFLSFDLRESYTEKSLDNKEVDIAVRITSSPNEGLVGMRHEGYRYSIYGLEQFRQIEPNNWPWLSWNLAYTNHDKWIDNVTPNATITARADNMKTHIQLAEQGFGVTVLSDLYMQNLKYPTDLIALADGWETTLWVLTHEELRSVPRIKRTMQEISSVLRPMFG